MFANNQINVKASGRSRSIFLDDKITLEKRFSNASYNEGRSVILHNNGVSVKMRNAFAENRADGDIVYSNAKPVYMVLRSMGVFPFTRDNPGHAEFKVLSPAMAYSVIVFVVLMVRRYNSIIPNLHYRTN